MASVNPALLHLVGQATRALPAARFAFEASRPAAAQLAKLRDILGRNADTEYGRRFGFGSIRTAAEYAERVPLMQPADLQPYVTRQMNGERNVLTAEAPIYYVRSTGTTGAPKHIPVTPSYRREFQITVHVSLWHLYNRFPAAFRGRALYFVGSRRVARAPDGNDVGTMSGFNFTEMPPLIRSVYAWPYELFEVADLATRNYLALYLACVGDISLITGIFPASVVYLLRELSVHAPELARDFRDGTLPGWLELDPAQRAFFVARAQARPDLARRLERAAHAPDEEKASLAWPRLRLAYCWMTSTAAAFVPELERRLGPTVALRDAIFAATEGWCTIPMGDTETGGALAVTSGYFEFIEESDFAAGSTRTVGAAELRDGGRYAIVLTGSAGVYRYVLGDILEVAGFHHDTPRLRFVYKSGAASNLGGEKLVESHATEAVGRALAAAGLEATWFALVGDASGPTPRYVLQLELAPAADGARLGEIAARVDAELGELAFDYKRMRAGRAMDPVAIAPMKAGTYAAHRQARVAAGAGEAQLKTVHLVDSPDRLPAELRHPGAPWGAGPPGGR